jgi:ERCC4-type nuclease
LITEPGIIYIDGRENKTRIDLIKKFRDKHKSSYKIKVIENMPTGDCVFGDLAMEFKRMSDFIGSIKSRNIFEQVLKMKRTGFKWIYVIISREENDFGEMKYMKDYGMHRNSVNGAIASIMSPRYGVNVTIMDTEEDAMYLAWKLIEKHNYSPAVLDRATIYPKMTKEDTKLNMLLTIPGLGKKKASALLKEFNGSTAEIAKAKEIEIMNRVPGIGRKIAKSIKEALK